jgi:hypothetical protein
MEQKRRKFMREIKGNLFDQKVDVICVTTNGSVHSDGRAVMGCGCAEEAATLFPELPLLLGTWIQSVGNHFHYLKYYEDRAYTVAAFPVKHSWQDEKADLKLIEESCKDLAESLTDGLTVALTRPGCGAGKRDWEKEVKPILEKHFKTDNFIIVDFENE